MARTFVAASSHQLKGAIASFSPGSVTLHIAFKRVDTATFAGIGGLFKTSDGAFRHGVYAGVNNAAGKVYASIEAAAGNSISFDSSNSFSTSLWNYATLRWVSGALTADVILNGTKTTSGAVAVAPTPTVDLAAVGCRAYNNSPISFFDGDVARMSVWTTDLTDAEVAMLELDVSPLMVRPGSLRHVWEFFGSYSPEIEIIGRGDLTVTGATASAHARIIVPASQLHTVYQHRFISGVTKNSNGAALASCTVKLYRTSDDVEVKSTTSDGSGNYSFTVADTSTQYYVVAYKAGAPDVAGTSVNTLVGA